MLLKGSAASGQNGPAISRENIIALYKNNAISKTALNRLTSSQDDSIRKNAQFILDVIEYSVEENNKIKSLLGYLKELDGAESEDKSLKRKKKDALATIKYLKENKELREYLEKSGALPVIIKELVGADIDSEEALQK